MHNEAAIEKSLKVKLVLIRNKCYQCKLVGTDATNEWCTILTIKTLTEVNRT